MTKITRKILNILFWVFLVIGIIMILWRIFGNSPTDLAIISPFVAMGIVKVWDVSHELKDFKYNVRLSFKKIGYDFSKVKDDMKRIENKIDGLNRPRGRR